MSTTSMVQACDLRPSQNILVIMEMMSAGSIRRLSPGHRVGEDAEPSTSYASYWRLADRQFSVSWKSRWLPCSRVDKFWRQRTVFAKSIAHLCAKPATVLVPRLRRAPSHARLSTKGYDCVVRLKRVMPPARSVRNPPGDLEQFSR